MLTPACHQVIFDLTLCGDWAGGVFTSMCSDVAGGDSCNAYVSKAANMQQAYWVINYVDIWELAGRTSTMQPATGFYGRGITPPVHSQ